MEPTTTTTRTRRRWPAGIAVVICALAAGGSLASATAPPDTSAETPADSAASTAALPTSAAVPTTAAPACVSADVAPTDSGSAAPAAAAASTSTSTTTSTSTSTTTSTTLAPTTTVAPTPAPPTIDVPLPAASPPVDGSTPTPPAAGSVTPDQQIILGRDGIGLGRFCEDADTVIAAVAGVLGEPSDDTGWSDPLTVSNCAGTEVRRVTWGSLDLYFGDTSRFADGVRHFFGYVYGNRDSLEVTPQGLATPEGIGVGSTVEYLLANYPDAEVFPGEEGIADPLFYVDENLGGFLTDDAADGVVTVLFGGEDCGV